MTVLAYPANDRPLPLEQAVARYWTIRRLARESAIDLGAATTALTVLAGHPNHGLASLCAKALAGTAATSLSHTIPQEAS